MRKLDPLPRRSLRPGMCIQVVAPASPFPIDDFEAGIARLRQRYEVRFDPTITAREGYLAGSDERRTRELLAAIEDDSIDAIVAARGGYGTTRLLPAISAATVARHPKPLIGFSDITALHVLWARAGLGSVHGPMVATLGRASDRLLQRWFGAAEGEPRAPIGGLYPVPSADSGKASQAVVSGRLLGGNLTVLTALMGTPYAPSLDECVLFLEDHGERPYRVDRMLTSWSQAGWLGRPRAIVLGAFTDCEPNRDGVGIDRVFERIFSSLEIPVLAGVPAGHLDDNMELPLGAIATLDARVGTLSFEACST